MKLLLIISSLFIFTACSPDRIEAECTHVKEVLNCSDGRCRVIFQNGKRYTTYVAAKGDLYCKYFDVYDEEEKREERGHGWSAYDDYNEVCQYQRRNHHECSVVKGGE